MQAFPSSAHTSFFLVDSKKIMDSNLDEADDKTKEKCVLGVNFYVLQIIKIVFT